MNKLTFVVAYFSFSYGTMENTPHASRPPSPSHAPRTYLPASRVVPSFPGTTAGGLDVWTHVFYLHAKTQFCLDLLLPLARSFASTSSTTTGGTSAAAARSIGPAEGDSNCQTRLAHLLYEWIDKATDWALFLRCDVTGPTLGVDM